MQEQCNGCYPGCPVKGCPYYKPEGVYEKCDFCGDWIYPDEEYIENDEGKMIHFDCVNDIADLVRWLGYTVGYMDYPEDDF